VKTLERRAKNTIKRFDDEKNVVILESIYKNYIKFKFIQSLTILYKFIYLFMRKN
jgi:hypothetical protein